MEQVLVTQARGTPETEGIRRCRPAATVSEASRKCTHERVVPARVEAN